MSSNSLEIALMTINAHLLLGTNYLDKGDKINHKTMIKDILESSLTLLFLSFITFYNI